MTFIKSCVYLSIILSFVGGFLLDGNTPNGQKQYLTLSEFYDNKNQQQHDTAELRHETEEIRHKMEQLKNDNAKMLALLTSQLQQRFLDIRNNITAGGQHNETARLVEFWELKYQELHENNTGLQIKFNDLEVKYTALKNEMVLRPTTQEIDIEQDKMRNASKELFSMAAKELVSLKNKTTVLENKMDTIIHFKAVQQLQDLHSVQNQIQEISTKTHALAVNEQARNQDFLALYNLTTVYGKKLQKLEIQSVNQSMQHANQNKLIVDKILRQINSADIKIEAVENTTREWIANTSERVTVTACVQSDKRYSSTIIILGSVKVQVGMTAVTSFSSSGIFTCEKPGLYLVDASIYCNTGNSKYSIRKNRSTVVNSYAAKDDTKYESASLVAAVELNVGDTIDIHADNALDILAKGSCVTIVKVR